MKCEKCGQTIKNPHYLNGKVYGYGCYRQELALFLADKEQKYNDDWNTKTMILVDVLRSRKSKNSFITSIIEQYENCGKMTGLQFKTVWKGLNELEKFEYKLQGFELGVEDSPRYDFDRDQKIMALYFDNPRIAILNKIWKRTNETTELLIEMKDEDEEKPLFMIIDKKHLNEYQNDEYIEYVKISTAY